MNKYGNEKIVTRAGGYTTVGDKYNRAGHGTRHWLYWNDNWRVGIPIVEGYTYENRLQAAQTTFHWREITEKEKAEFKLFEYPRVENYTVASILTQGPGYVAADQYLRYMNGWLNTTQAGYKKVRIWILVFVDQPEKAGEMQEMYWKRGNKNEFTVMFGINKEGDVQWHRIMSWTKKEAVKIEVRDEINMNMTGKLDQEAMVKFSKFLGDKIHHGYVKPDFREYNYLTVEPGMIGIIVTFIIVLLVSIGVGIFIVKNDIDNPDCEEPEKDEKPAHFREIQPSRFISNIKPPPTRPRPTRKPGGQRPTRRP